MSKSRIMHNAMPGIYAIVHIPTGKKYIGMSGDINARHREHIYYLNHGNHHCKELQHLWNESHDFDFALEVLERFEIGVRDRKMMRTRESHFITMSKDVLNVKP